MPNWRLSREQSRWSSVVPERSPGNSRQTALATGLELAAGRGRSFQAKGAARRRLARHSDRSVALHSKR
jgi:hypothetical protein